MQVDAELYYWTINSMRRQPLDCRSQAYVTKEQAERLLEEAHRRGYERGCEDMQDQMNRKEK